MKTILVALLLMLSFNVLSEEKNCEQLIKNGATQEQLAQRGCCSWHGGVCSCAGGRAVCCDGSLSPSCGCHAEDSKLYIENETEAPKS